MMESNSIPKVAIGWGIAALRRHVDEIEQETRALQFLMHRDDLTDQILAAYQAMVTVIQDLDARMNRLEAIAKQGGVPLEHK